MGNQSPQRRDVEGMAEWLALEQLDLLAQVEAQLRAVHHTMRRIEKLRGGQHHVGPELSNSQRSEVLTGLAEEMAALDEQIVAQAACCHAMLATVQKMQQRLEEIKRSGLRVPPEFTDPRSANTRAR